MNYLVPGHPTVHCLFKSLMSTFVRIVPAQLEDIFFIHCEVLLSITCHCELTYSNLNGHNCISDLLITLIQALGKKKAELLKEELGKISARERKCVSYGAVAITYRFTWENVVLRYSKHLFLKILIKLVTLICLIICIHWVWKIAEHAEYEHMLLSVSLSVKIK